MDSKVRICPNCGAHVVTGDNICPACDHPLDAPPPDAAPGDADATEIFPAPPLLEPDAGPTGAGDVIPDLELPTGFDLPRAGEGDDSEPPPLDSGDAPDEARWDWVTVEQPPVPDDVVTEDEPGGPASGDSEWEGEAPGEPLPDLPVLAETGPDSGDAVDIEPVPEPDGVPVDVPAEAAPPDLPEFAESGAGEDEEDGEPPEAAVDDIAAKDAEPGGYPDAVVTRIEPVPEPEDDSAAPPAEVEMEPEPEPGAEPAESEAATHPRLDDDLTEAAAGADMAWAQAPTEPQIDAGPEDAPGGAPEEVTVARFGSEFAPPPSAPDMQVTSASQPVVPAEGVTVGSEAATPRRRQQPGYLIPPAPYAPPPQAAPVMPPATLAPPPALAYAPPAPAYGDQGMQAALAYLQQRIHAYRQGGYRVLRHTPHKATLAGGKRLGAVGWLLALVSLIGVVWIAVNALLSGFRADRVYLSVEADGRVYEDGPGAAHVRRKRVRAGRRWSVAGAVVFVVAFVLALGLLVVAWIAIDRYTPELREAYPEVTLFEETHADEQANPDDVEMVEDGAVVFSILAGIAAVGLWGGATLFVIGALHALAYRSPVPPLPGYD